MADYIFTSQRLGFRNWVSADVPSMTEISANKEVMEFFPYEATPAQTKTFIERMQTMFTENGYCYFAVDRIDTNEFIGFIGLCYQKNNLSFSPYIDIGWRLSPKHWGNGFATEGAKRCLQYAFEKLKLKTILSTAPLANIKSIAVMEKIGMSKKFEFIHPKLLGNKYLENCVCYSVSKKTS
ncbi:MAG: GNAT family N-acetyltransferase [Flavobacteriales bacterium]|nr:GNAT family N-acetyltransferase [Flavobacteriales bacterium]